MRLAIPGVDQINTNVTSSDATTIRFTHSLNSKIGFRPLGDRVLVRQLEEQDEIVNGIVRPDIAKEKPLEGEVVAIGNGKIFNGERIPIDVQVGQRVAFGRWSGNQIKVKDIEYLILNESELQGCYEE
jgi:chaperonin GroES